MKFAENIFKAYDIRGKVPDELTPEVAQAIGKAVADFLLVGQVVVGRDMRNDSEALAKAFVKGLTTQGRHVIDLGLITTDMIYFATGHLKTAGGAMITASHNPGQYDGIKLCGQGVVPIGEDSGLGVIKATVQSDSYKPANSRGRVEALDIKAQWMDHVMTFVDIDQLKPYKMAIDAGNGMAGILIADLSQRTPLQIDCMYCSLDGNFPNHPANPIIRANLADEVREIHKRNLDFGIAFDGDGDRAVFIDDKDRPVPMGELGALLCEHFLKQNPGATIVYDVRSSKIVPDTIERCGGKAVRSPAGHTNIKALMRKHNAVFGAEQSGHYYFRNNYYADSGMIAAMLTVDILSKSDKKLSELIAPYMVYANSGEINFEMADKATVIDRVAKEFPDGEQDHLDGLTVNYPDWWFNLRPSNTEPFLRLNVEAHTTEVLQEKLGAIEKIINASS